MDLIVDKQRMNDLGDAPGTGIYVRAMDDGKWGSHDILVLDKKSLLVWLKSRGGDNPWAEDVVGILLGHGHLHERPEEQHNG